MAIMRQTGWLILRRTERVAAPANSRIVNLGVGHRQALQPGVIVEMIAGPAGLRAGSYQEDQQPVHQGPVAAGNRRGKKRIAVRHNVKPEKTKTAYCALTEGENQLPGHIPEVGQHHQQQGAPGGAHAGAAPVVDAVMKAPGVHQSPDNQ